MKKILFYFLFAALAFPDLYSQEAGAAGRREIYLSGNFWTFSDFGLQYKTELNNNNYFRIGLASLNPAYHKFNPGSSTVVPTSSVNISGSFDIGLEKRRSVNEKLTAFYGVNLYSSVSYGRFKREDPTLPLGLRHKDSYDISSGFGFNSGLILRLSENFSVSAEIRPRLLMTYHTTQNISGMIKTTDTSISGTFSLNTSSVGFSVIYAWNKI